MYFIIIIIIVIIIIVKTIETIIVTLTENSVIYMFLRKNRCDEVCAYEKGMSMRNSEAASVLSNHTM